ncbi:MAG: hypothetical protein BroJett018_32800 [Chloroflexota bacterium]|nr:MAG: hypothetical protein BroJett018_32800 [Chloroflexota bacterium]
MSHRHKEERDSGRQVRSRRETADFNQEDGAWGAFNSTLSPKNILHLQRRLGNQAVLGLLAKQQKANIQRAPEAKKQVKSPPSWSRVSSTNPLPGEHVPGITDRQAPIMLQDEDGNPIYTEQDRERLKDALMSRHEQNAQNGPDFAANFASALLEIWTGYVTEDMAKTADDASWSMLQKLVLFVLKEAAISMLFPPAKLATLAAKASKLIVGASADLTQDAIEDDSVKGKVKKRGKELRDMTTGLSANLQLVIRTAFDEVSDSFYYQDWLDHAPLQKLHLFRLPPAIPAVPKENIEVMIAQQLTGLIHDQEDTWIGKHRESALGGLLGYITFNEVKNGIYVKVAVDGAENEQITDPVLNAPEILAKRLRGHAISEMPQVPLLIELGCAPLNRVYSKDEADAIAALEAHWPQSAPMEIKISPDGKLMVIGGGLREMFYLYSRVNPLADLGSLAVLYFNGMEGDGMAPPVNVAAVDLYYWFYPYMEDGARELYANSVMPLRIPQRQQS